VLDALVAPADVAAWAVTVTPGPDVIAPLSVVDPSTVDGPARIDLLVAYERQLAWLQAAQQHVLACLEGEALDWAGKQSIDYTEEQVSAALRLAPRTAASRLDTARALVDRLPATLGMLTQGEITYLHAKKLAEAVVDFDPKTTTQVEDRVLRRAAGQTVGQFGASLHRAMIAADPRQAQERCQDAVEQRRVEFIPQDDGMTGIWAYLPAESAALIQAVLDSLASAKIPGELRTADQRRADCLVDVFARVLGDPSLPEQHGHRPSIHVTVALSTLLGCDDAPAELDGYGPITAAAARAIAADPTGTWRRLLTDPATGQLLEYGRTTYRPPTNLADFIIARDPHCVFPTCRRPARTCELDHADPYCTGGVTCPHNLHPLCRRHHHTKHNASWTIHRQHDGTYHWTAPTGHTYTIPPPDS
jgi:hypothetical protein